MDYGILVAVTGASIYSSDLEDYAIHSGYPNLKALDTDPAWPTSVTIASGTRFDNYVLTHNLGYRPLYDIYFKDQSNRMVHVPGKSTDTYGTRGIILTEDDNSITVELGRPDPSYPTDVTYDVFHYIYYDPNDPSQY